MDEYILSARAEQEENQSLSHHHRTSSTGRKGLNPYLELGISMFTKPKRYKWLFRASSLWRIEPQPYRIALLVKYSRKFRAQTESNWLDRMFEQSELTLGNLILFLVLGVCSASLLGACRVAIGA